MEKIISIHTDGGSRGNPGPSACGFVAEENGEVIFKGSKYLGVQTNNFAEYSAIILALEWIVKEVKVDVSKTQIVFYSDSELIVKQIIGLYKIKNENLLMLCKSVIKMIKDNSLKIAFKNIPRVENKEADLLVNVELDSMDSV